MLVRSPCYSRCLRPCRVVGAQELDAFIRFEEYVERGERTTLHH
jgi:hypothetical protein